MAWRQLARRLSTSRTWGHSPAWSKSTDKLSNGAHSFGLAGVQAEEAVTTGIRSACHVAPADVAAKETQHAGVWIGAMRFAGSRQNFSTSATEGGATTSSTTGEGEGEDVPEAESVEQLVDSERTKLLVLGGNGFVGSAICKEAISRGLPVLSLNRSGPPGVKESWVEEVDWVRGNVFETDQWRHLLPEVSAVISCIGAFGSNDFMRKINGDANVTAVTTAAEEGVKRFVYISAHDVGLPSFVLRGYFEGKRAAEEAVREHFPYSGVILRPGMIHGTRQVGSISLPLGVVGAPLEMVLKNAKWASQLPLIGPALVPPVKVTAVAKTAVRGAVDNAIPPGAVDVWGILRFGDQ